MTRKIQITAIGSKQKMVGEIVMFSTFFDVTGWWTRKICSEVIQKKKMLDSSFCSLGCCDQYEYCRKPTCEPVRKLFDASISETDKRRACSGNDVASCACEWEDKR
jgi:hypothetical protein